MSQPALSAIVVVGPQRERGGACIRSLLAQGLGERLEIVLLDLAPPVTTPVPGSDDPSVRLVPLPPDTLFSQARAAGVRAARAPVVAFIEEHCSAYPGWAEAILEAFRGPWAGVGSAMACGNPGVGTSDIAGLLAYGYWYPPVAAGDCEMLPGHNACFRREVLLGYGQELDQLLRSDLVLHGRLRRDGYRLAIEPRAMLAHRNETTLKSRARGVYLWYRMYGFYRARERRWSAVRRLTYLLTAPLAPLYFYAHFLPRIVRERPRYLPLLLRHPLFVLASIGIGAFGQALGVVFGPGDAEAQFTRFEVEEPRPLSRDAPAAAA